MKNINYNSYARGIRGIILVYFLCGYATLIQAQPNMPTFWQLNGVSSRLIWDASASNNQVDNGSGSWSFTEPNWTATKGISNLAWIPGKDAVFGGNPGVGPAGTVTLSVPINNVKSISFNPAASGNFTITGQSISNNGSFKMPIFVAGGLSPTIASVLTGNFGITKTGSGTLNLTGSNTFSGDMVISDGSVNYATNSALGASSKTVTLGDVNTPPGNTASFSIGNGTTTTQTVTAVITTDYAIPQFTLNTGSTLGGNTTGLLCELRLNGNKPLTYFSTNTSGHSTAQDWTGRVSGTGIAPGNTALIFDGTAAALRATWGGTDGVTPNNFTGDVIIKGTVNTQGTTYSGQVPARQNLGFNNNYITLVSPANWAIVWGCETINGLNGTGTVSLSNQNAINNIGLIIGNNNGNGSFSGSINGGFGISKIGTGTQTISNGALTYGGVTNINGGMLELNNTTDWRSTVLNAQAGTIWKKSGTTVLLLSWGTGGNYTQMKMLAGSTFDIQGGKVQNNNVTNEWVNNLGSVNIASGATLDLYSDPIYLDALTGSGTITNGFAPNGVRTLYVGVSNTTDNASYGVSNTTATFSGVINNANGNVAVVKQGTGTQILSGNNTYSGGTTINNGTITANSATALGTGAVTINNGGILILNANITNAITLNPGGTLTLNGRTTGTVTNNGGIINP